MRRSESSVGWQISSGWSWESTKLHYAWPISHNTPQDRFQWHTSYSTRQAAKKIIILILVKTRIYPLINIYVIIYSEHSEEWLIKWNFHVRVIMNVACTLNSLIIVNVSGSITKSWELSVANKTTETSRSELAYLFKVVTHVITIWNDNFL